MNEINDNRTIFRRAKDKDNPYVMVSKSILEDTTISWKSKGLLVYLLSRPDDWKVWLSDLEKRSTDGRDATASAVQELEAAGYMTRHQNRNDQGQFEGLLVLVHEDPVPPERRTTGQPPSVKALSDVNTPPEPGFPEPAKPEPENPAYTNTNHTKTEGTKNEQPEQPTSVSPISLPADFWEEDEGPEIEEQRDVVAGAIAELSGKLGEYHQVNSNVARAKALQERAGVRDHEFVVRAETAADITEGAMKKRKIKQPMAYFFGVLETNLGLKPKDDNG